MVTTYANNAELAFKVKLIINMLRAASSIRTLRFNYNNFNNWRRYNKNAAIQTEQKIFKKEFKPGD